MSSDKSKYIGILEILVNELVNIRKVLESINISGKIYDSESLLAIYDKLFLSSELSNHIEYEVSFVAKSTHALIYKPLNKDNANRHIKLNIKSSDALWIDQIYDNKISDLLIFFKHLFSIVENFSIFHNVEKVRKFEILVDEIKLEIQDFISISILNEQQREKTLQDLKNKEIQEVELLKKGQQFKSDWQLYVEIINSNNIKCLFHFTDSSNISSIKERNGLYSWDYSIRNGIPVSKYGGNEFSRNLDLSKGAQNYVRLSFCKDHPMKHTAIKDNRITNPVLLELSCELIYHTGTKFCNINATRNDAIISDSFDYFKCIDFSIVKCKNQFELSSELRPFYQAEILVFEHVPLKYILNIDRL